MVNKIDVIRSRKRMVPQPPKEPEDILMPEAGELVDIPEEKTSNLMPLNKYLAHSGVCARRKSAELIYRGTVTINGVVVREPGYRIKPADVVKIGTKVVKPQKKIYLLLNKPGGYITAHVDERGRPTVMELVKGAAKERLHAIGRLDFNTTGLLVITSDGDLTQRLAHPQYEVHKTYQVRLDKPLQGSDIQKMRKGIDLQDGKVTVDHVMQLGRQKAKVVIHSGKYRIIRRLFKKLGYNVLTLDRVNYAGLTKKGLKEGSWRYLSRKEVEALKKL